MKKILALVATASLMFSCSQEVTPDLEKLPINISVGQQTRANDSTYESGDEVGIYVVNYVGSTAGSLKATGNQVDNMRFIYSNSSWTPDETIYWKDKTTAADFYAYYPYSESPNISAHPFAVAADQSAEEDFWDSDFLWGKTANVSPTSSAVPIVTNHSLSRILVDVVPGDGFAGTWGNAAVSVKICDVKTSATIDLATGVATATGENGEIVPLAAAETGTTLSYKAMMIPQVVADNSKLVVVTVDGVDYIYRKGYEFKANTEHKFTVTVNKTGGSVEMSIGEWKIDSTTNEGDAEDESVSSENTIPNNEIWYTTTDGNIISKSGSDIESNTYENGKGVIVFKEDLTTIKSEMFSEKTTLSTITLPNSVTAIYSDAFYGCENLTIINLPNQLKTISKNAFSGCVSLTAISIPNSVTSIGESAFSSCSSLTDVSLPTGITTIAKKMFSGSGLTKITIPENISTIDYQAFGSCENLETVIITNATLIGERAFYSCKKLANITLSDNLNKISKEGFSFCTSLSSIVIPDSVRELGDYAFGNCTNLNDISLSADLYSLGINVFQYCTNLESITIPSKIYTIGASIFYECSKLASVKFESSTPPNTSGDPFYQAKTLTNIIVPTASVESYKSANVWSNYANIIVGY